MSMILKEGIKDHKDIVEYIIKGPHHIFIKGERNIARLAGGSSYYYFLLKGRWREARDWGYFALTLCKTSMRRFEKIVYPYMLLYVNDEKRRVYFSQFYRKYAEGTTDKLRWLLTTVRLIFPSNLVSSSVVR
jgi:hypothetical protein